MVLHPEQARFSTAGLHRGSEDWKELGAGGKKLSEMANQECYPSNYDDKYVQNLTVLEKALAKRIHLAGLRECCVRRAAERESEGIGALGKVSAFRRDCMAKEAESIKLMLSYKELGLDLRAVEEYLEYILERGNFDRPMGLLQRLGERCTKFAVASRCVERAPGHRIVTIRVDTTRYAARHRAVVRVSLEGGW